MSAFVSKGSLYLTGAVGEYFSTTSEFFTHEDVMTALDGMDQSKKIPVHVNSGGGDAYEGLAIYSALSSLPHGVDVVVEGIAASAGSVIAMAGRTITMSQGSIMMIHDASGMTYGNPDEHQKTLNALNSISNVLAGVYALKTKKTISACRELMKLETWFEPQQAVDAGFADKVSGSVSKTKMVAAFDYSKFQHAPKQLVDLASAKNWKAAATLPEPPKEKKMTDPNPATAARAEATARIRAITCHAEARDRSELAQHLAFETDMEPEAAIAVLAKSGKSTATTSQASAYEQRRLAASALAMPVVRASGDDVKPSALVENMKRRNGIK